MICQFKVSVDTLGIMATTLPPIAKEARMTARSTLRGFLFLVLLFNSISSIARTSIRVDEEHTRLTFNEKDAQLSLVVSGDFARDVPIHIQLEFLDPNGDVWKSISQDSILARGSKRLDVTLPDVASRMKERLDPDAVWTRVRYRLTADPNQQNSVETHGIVAISEISAQSFVLSIGQSFQVIEGSRCRIYVFTQRPGTKLPVPNVSVTGKLTISDDSGEQTLETSSKTNSSGLAMLDFDIPENLDWPDIEINVTASLGGFVREAREDIDFANQTELILTSDKPLYQPGQYLRFRVLAFGASHRALRGVPLELSIQDPESSTVFRTESITSQFGEAHAEWVIPDNARLGDYEIAVERKNSGSSVRRRIKISRYDLPAFTVTPKPDRTYYLPGQNAKVEVRADYLFGKPVIQGHVRVVRESERHWNYRDQKWEVEEGPIVEGEFDASGLFVATIDLAADHDGLEGRSHERYADLGFSAYVTDSTSNRTEQRRFDLRISKEPIHIYVSENGNANGVPLEFYISTFYPDGKPAKSSVAIYESGTNNEQLLKTVSTNRYGVAKVTDLRSDASNLTFVARDGKAGTGRYTTWIRRIGSGIRVYTNKTVYRRGEPIEVEVHSTYPSGLVILEIHQDAAILLSKVIQLHNGKTFDVVRFNEEFKDDITIAAAYASGSDAVATRTVVYPRDRELKIETSLDRTSYVPGKDGSISFRIRGPDGLPQPSLLGVVMLDKAIEERARTDKDFGQDDWFCYHCFGGRYGEVLTSLSRRDLDRLDLTLPVPDDVDLAADVLLNSNFTSTYFPLIKEDSEPEPAFRQYVQRQLEPLKRALDARFAQDRQHPTDEASLYSLLLAAGIDMNGIRDPWETPYRAEFSVIRHMRMMNLISAGPDKRFGTSDDLHALHLNWAYFQAHKDAIEKAAHDYHERTDAFIRDEVTLKAELLSAGQDFDSWRDPWRHAYQLDFGVSGTRYTINVKSSGPDGPFRAIDSFTISTTTIDYSWKVRNSLDQIVTWFFEHKKTLPNDTTQFDEAVRSAGVSAASLLDPWNQPFYPVFRMQNFYADRLRITANADQCCTQHTESNPVTSTIQIVALRSLGRDGIEGTRDDFDVAAVSRVLSEHFSRYEGTQTDSGTHVLQVSAGAIRGFVTDASGAVIPGVSVEAKSPQQQVWTTVTDAMGNYIFRNLPPGIYYVSFSLPGFVTKTIQEVPVRASLSTEITVTLEVGAVAQNVEVSAGSLQTLNVVSAEISVVKESASKPPAAMLTPRLREYFPETLLWEPAVETDRSGKARIPFKLPDNITTWKMSAIVSTADGQIGRADKEVVAFQPFFVEHDPPKTLTEGDEIALPVVIRSYLEKDQTVELTMHPQDWFAGADAAARKINIKPGQAAREIFNFRTVKPVTGAAHRITAKGNRVSDAIEKPVTIHPNGKQVTNVASDIVRTGATYAVAIPDDVIPNTMRAEVRIYPNLISHVVDGIEGILQRPYGCAEQTISSAYPSLMLLRYYENNGNGSPVLAAKARRYLRAGLDRLWAYQTSSGGFSYWGEGEADIAVTAYAMRFLIDARDIVPVDDDALSSAYTWLVRQQQSDGSWVPSVKYRSSSKAEVTTLTALVTRVLSLPGVHKSAEGVKRNSLKDALDYLRKRTNEFEEPYAIASLANAAQNIGDTELAEVLLAHLERLAHFERGGAYWDLQTNTPFYGWGLAGRIETTALAVHALTASHKPDLESLANQGLLFLLRTKDRFGVWHSTQATVNALDALLPLAARPDANTLASPSYIVVNGRITATITTPGNTEARPIVQDISPFLNGSLNQVEIRGSFAAAATVQFSESYYVPWDNYRDPGSEPAGALSFTVHFDKTEAGVGDEIVADVHAERIGFQGYGMMLAEIGLPPGVDVDRASLEEAIKTHTWDLYRYDVLPDRLIAYLWPRAGGTDFQFKFRFRYAVKAQTAESKLYDYYNPDAHVTVRPVHFNVR